MPISFVDTVFSPIVQSHMAYQKQLLETTLYYLPEADIVDHPVHLKKLFSRAEHNWKMTLEKNETQVSFICLLWYYSGWF